jgi:hypothetical protein
MYLVLFWFGCLFGFFGYKGSCSKMYFVFALFFFLRAASIHFYSRKMENLMPSQKQQSLKVIMSFFPCMLGPLEGRNGGWFQNRAPSVELVLGQ